MTTGQPPQWYPFNINRYIRVKVTESGFAVMDAQDRRLNAVFKKIKLPLRSLRVRAEQAEHGWSTRQAWDVMQTFGPSIRMGGPVPIETTIEFKGMPSIWGAPRA